VKQRRQRYSRHCASEPRALRERVSARETRKSTTGGGRGLGPAATSRTVFRGVGSPVWMWTYRPPSKRNRESLRHSKPRAPLTAQAFVHLSPASAFGSSMRPPSFEALMWDCRLWEHCATTTASRSDRATQSTDAALSHAQGSASWATGRLRTVPRCVGSVENGVALAQRSLQLPMTHPV
jgi:hypothetical protein